MNIHILIQQIEQKRNELIHIGLLHGLNSPTVLKESQELDRLLNLYESMLQVGKKTSYN